MTVAVVVVVVEVIVKVEVVVVVSNPIQTDRQTDRQRHPTKCHSYAMAPLALPLPDRSGDRVPRGRRGEGAVG